MRCTFNGASAALAKFGALVGGFTFQPIYNHFGMFAVMATCAAISLMGALVTHLCIESDELRQIPRKQDLKVDHSEHLLAPGEGSP